MKPISLKIAGLHSFREEQEIRFDELSGLGVFGIFGPTGSGKSSILDAMTLALYGTVVRAGRRTQGILNHGEKHVRVVFTFSLGRGQSLRTYRVERRYTRKDQLAVANSHSRLIAVTADQEEVLADKDREVTEQVTGLLGLREEDFTRAVVLPQGKFADFLNLGGKERREMLQRLFSLEQYGNVLINRVNERYKTAEISFIEADSEQKGLGDASTAAVEQAQAALTAANQIEVQAVAELKGVQEQYDEAREVYGLQVELQRKQQELTTHRGQQAELERVAAVLELAGKAERVAPLAAEFTASQAEEQAALTAKEQATTGAQRLAEASQRLSVVYKQACETRLKEEPGLIERKTRLEVAVTLESEISHSEREAVSINTNYQNQQAVFHKHNTAIDKLTTSGQQLIAEIKTLEEKVTNTTISAEQRGHVQDCLAKAQILVHNLAVADKVRQAGTERQRQHQTAQVQAAQAGEKLHQAEIRLTQLEVAEAKVVQEQLQAANAQFDRLVLSEKLAAAARLAAGLQEGRPCPVCGSLSHPYPAASDEQSAGSAARQGNLEQQVAVAKAHIEKVTRHLEQAKIAVAAGRQAAAEAQAHAAALGQQETAALAELTKSREEYATIRVTASEALNQLIGTIKVLDKTVTDDLTAGQALQHVSDLNEYISNQDKVYEAYRRQVNSLRQEHDSCQSELTRLQQIAKDCETTLAATAVRLAAANELLTGRRCELAALTQGIPAKQLLSRTAELLETVRRAESEAKEDYDQAAEAKVAADQAVARCETSWREAVTRCQEAATRLNAKLTVEGFATVVAVNDALLAAERRQEYERLLKLYQDNEQKLTAQCEQLTASLRGRSLAAETWQQIQQAVTLATEVKNIASEQRVEASKECRDLAAKHQRWSVLEDVRQQLTNQLICLQALKNLLRGNIFVEFLAQEQMELVARYASERLKQITQHRYALELASDGGFLIRDDANGGVKRPVSTLSGGETFQTSLALALALSTQIQLKGKYPLEFFFLDEGFGSLDQHALDTAMNTLEKLHLENMTIGVISHVAELKQRMPRRLLVEPAEPAGRGSRVWMELA